MSRTAAPVARVSRRPLPDQGQDTLPAGDLHGHLRLRPQVGQAGDSARHVIGRAAGAGRRPDLDPFRPDRQLRALADRQRRPHVHADAHARTHLDPVPRRRAALEDGGGADEVGDEARGRARVDLARGRELLGRSRAPVSEGWLSCNL